MAVATITTLLGNQGDPVEYTVLATTAIAKGTLMQLSSSPQTATAAGADGEFFCGIAASEKTTTDGVDKMACITHCIAQITAGVGTTTFGVPQKISAANAVVDADDDNVEKCAEVVGIALEDIADGEQGAVLVNC